MKYHQCKQKSDEWFAIRLEHPLTASHAQAIGNQGKGLDTLCWEKIAEKNSKGEKTQYTNEHLERGNELEEEARVIYEFETGNSVTEIGFVTNTSISKIGGVSPDDLVDEDGLTEIKCFADAKHFQMSVKGLTIESKYMWQMQMQLLFTERKWCDFVAYNPNFEKSLLVERVFPDKEMQDKIIAGLKKGEDIINNINKQV